MNDYTIVFSPHAKLRMEEMADYLYQKSLSKEFVVDYLNRFEIWLETLLCQFPESGAPMPEYGNDVRRVAYKKYIIRLKACRNDGVLQEAISAGLTL